MLISFPGSNQIPSFGHPLLCCTTAIILIGVILASGCCSEPRQKPKIDLFVCPPLSGGGPEPAITLSEDGEYCIRDINQPDRMPKLTVVAKQMEELGFTGFGWMKNAFTCTWEPPGDGPTPEELWRWIVGRRPILPPPLWIRVGRAYKAGDLIPTTPPNPDALVWRRPDENMVEIDYWRIAALREPKGKVKATMDPFIRALGQAGWVSVPPKNSRDPVTIFRPATALAAAMDPNEILKAGKEGWSTDGPWRRDRPIRLSGATVESRHHAALADMSKDLPPSQGIAKVAKAEAAAAAKAQKRPQSHTPPPRILKRSASARIGKVLGVGGQLPGRLAPVFGAPPPRKEEPSLFDMMMEERSGHQHVPRTEFRLDDPSLGPARPGVLGVAGAPFSSLFGHHFGEVEPRLRFHQDGSVTIVPGPFYGTEAPRPVTRDTFMGGLGTPA